MSRVFSFPQEKRENNNGRIDSPDPTAYDVISGMKAVRESSPEWTFSKNENNGSHGDNQPGPGQYDADINKLKHNVSVSYSMGKNTPSQNQTRISRDQMPGPGSYDISITSKSPTFSMNGKQAESKPNDIPGPGSYQNVSEFGQNSRKAVITSRPKTARNDTIPGPGQYDAKSRTIGGETSQRGASTMRNREERILSPNKFEREKLGPGAYDANPHAVRDKTPNFRFGTGSREDIISKEEKLKPGPGAYEIKNLKSQRAIKIGQRIQQTLKNDVPGPGNYEPNHNIGKASVRGVKILKQQNKSSMVHSKSSNLVGPGDYYQDKDFGRNAKKVSIYGKPKAEKPKDIPGPGQYDPSDHLLKDKVVTTAVMRSNQQRSNQNNTLQLSTPGPGNYYNNSDFAKNVPSFTIKGRTEIKSKDFSPGPGAYDANDQLIKAFTPSYKYGNSSRKDIISKQEKEMPGPGQYNSVSHKAIGKDVPKFTMGKRQIINERELSPGPGAYQPNHNVIKDNLRKVNMGTSKRSEIVNKTAQGSPGPGFYETPNKLIGKGGLQYSMKSKRPDLKPSDNPGPGAYDALDTINRDKSPSYRLGTGSRTQLMSKSMLELPGPGHYDQKAALGRGPQFSFQSRLDIKIKDDKPGPGNYDPNSKVIKDNVIAYKMSQGSRADIVSKEVSDKPGPGQYSEHYQFGQNSLKVSIQGRAEPKIRNDIPGPGKYDQSIHMVKDKVISHKLDSKSARSEIVTKEMLNQPGPGEYDSPIKIGWGAQSVSIKGRPEDNIREDSPGPGQYDPKSHVVKDKIRGFKMDQQQRADIISKDQKTLPGPGIYEQPSTLGKNTYSYTMSGKTLNNFDNKLPGPGTYEPNEGVTKFQSPSVKISSGQKSSRIEFLSDEKISMPGPGAYEQHSNIGKGRSAQIKGRTNPEKINDVPGPGQYEASPDVVKDRVKSAKIGTHKRDFLSFRNVDLQKPGPGQYEQKLPQNNITYSMGTKAQYKPKNDIPGPGSYDQQDKLTKHQIASANFSRSPDRSINISPRKDIDVGPGQYDLNNPSHLIGYSFSKGELKAPFNDTPGPGYYNLPSKFADVPSYAKINQREEFKYV